ncbi:MAG TPA: glycosyltransferase [Hypericibacter adhaerens]|jgi:glycosyltransferase involved in cell wall biosynthesis|uniref:Glycosyl transferase family A n=1 Tax=Hypericibacter adhaerens TaxID=2602016 RepID=A0A5J6MZJ1_9PROT|nr:glycosyltransferase [Hypericibacter adhaerens]QEX23198.1 glycosyl transferase family A [Hypericibacter adhaerens]HWA44639.1 glycosyltransferase [Hypericibacter adhaerens]
MPSAAISIIMAVRNGEQYIAEALDSVAVQRAAQVELLIVDDGSTDRTAAIAGGHPMAPILIHQEPAGLAAALNRAMERARGTLLCFLDHDDVWPEGRLGAMFDALQATPSLEAVFGRVVNTDSALRPIAPPIPSRLITAMLARRDLFERVGPFRTDLAHAANVDWISRAEAGGMQSRFLDRIVLWRRIHGENMGVRDRGTARTDMLRVIRDHHNRTRKS